MSELSYQLKYQPVSIVRYPLQNVFIFWGLLGALFVGGFLLSFLAGFAILTLFISLGFLWRKDEIPVLPFCIAFQWLFIVAGYFYRLLMGAFPGFVVIGELEKAVLLSLLGLLVIVAGIRTGIYLLRKRTNFKLQKLHRELPRYNLRKLFWIVIMLNFVNWVMEIAPMEIAFNIAQLIYRVLEFRGIFLLILLLAIFRQRQGYFYGIVAFVYIWISGFSSRMSAVVGAFIPVFIVILTEWKPWAKTARERIRNRRIIIGTLVIVFILFSLALLWQGGVKPVWRHIVLPRLEEESQIAKISSFVETATSLMPQINSRFAITSLVQRLSSALGYFSHVLIRVPEIIPYEKGKLIRRALYHITHPRFLFPDKPNLGSDSWLVLTYAGMPAAGPEQGTSIGIGYMAEFYIDFGIPGMFIPLFFLGILVGLIYSFISLVSPSHYLFTAGVTIIFLQHFSTYGAEIAKLLGGLVMAFIMFSVLLYLFGEWLHRKLF